MDIDLSTFDLEELDDAEREELEAMLYAQVHHAASIDEAAAPASSIPAPPHQVPPKISQPVTLKAPKAASEPLTNGYDPAAALDSKKVSVAAVPRNSVTKSSAGSPATAVSGDLVKDTAAAAQLASSANSKPASQTVQKPSGTTSVSPPNGVSGRSSVQSPEPSSVASTSALPPKVSSQASTSALSRPEPSSVAGPSGLAPKVTSQASTSTPIQQQVQRKRPLSVSDDDVPETKTAALEASARRRGSVRPAPEPLTVHGSSSASSDDDNDELVIEAAPTRADPEVVDLAVSPPDVPEVILSDGEIEDEEEAIVEPPMRPAAPAVPPVRSAVPPVRASAPALKKIPTKRARTVASVKAAAAAGSSSRQQRPRTSSDLSSSDDDAGGGVTIADDIDIHVNVHGSGVERKRREETLAEQMANRRLGLPDPACRRALRDAQLTAEERRLLEPLCRARPCHKWGERQRDAYTTPRDYGPEDVGSVQAAMSESSDWDIPVQYLMKGRATPKSRYYSNLAKNRCRRCDDLGHMAASCPLPPVCHLCGNSGHSGEFRCPNMFCYTCGRPNHLSQHCPRHVKRVFCALCKASGHISEQCPDLWRRFHATTRSGPPLQPPAPLEKKRARRVSCWQCGERGHYGHHCGDERYTGAASLSHQVISYTESTSASREVSGLVATPAQMDAIFMPRQLKRLERETGATLTYERLGNNSWMINISGDLESARAAHSHVQAILQGRKVDLPRPSSAPCSPQPRRRQAGGASSAPASPEASPVREREGEQETTAEQSAVKERRKQERQARREAKRAARRQQRAAAAADAAAEMQGQRPRHQPPPPDVIDVDSGSMDVVLVNSGSEEGEVRSDDVMVVGESRPGPASAKAETVTVDSDDGEGLDELASVGRRWSLALLDRGNEIGPTSKQQTLSKRLTKKQQRKLAQEAIAASAAAAAAAAAEAAEENANPASSDSSSNTGKGEEEEDDGPATSKKKKKKGRNLSERKATLELQLAALTKSKLSTSVLARLPPGWENAPDWRSTLLRSGLPPEKVPKPISRGAAKQVLKAAAAGHKQPLDLLLDGTTLVTPQPLTNGGTPWRDGAGSGGSATAKPER